jgi:hypothetical protein
MPYQFNQFDPVQYLFILINTATYKRAKSKLTHICCISGGIGLRKCSVLKKDNSNLLPFRGELNSQYLRFPLFEKQGFLEIPFIF